MYVEKIDYIGRISMSMLDVLLAEDENNILADASREAEGAISTMAGTLYDIAPELQKTGNARNGYILGLAKSIGIYNIYQRADDTMIPDKVIKNYDDAMEALEKISNGKKVLDIPGKTATNSGTEGDESISTNGTGLRRFGSQAKRTHRI